MVIPLHNTCFGNSHPNHVFEYIGNNWGSYIIGRKCSNIPTCVPAVQKWDYAIGPYYPIKNPYLKIPVAVKPVHIRNPCVKTPKCATVQCLSGIHMARHH
jgi:hypothetical protein